MNTTYILILLLFYMLFTVLIRKGNIVDKLGMIIISVFPIYFVMIENEMSLDKKFLFILFIGFIMRVIHKALDLDRYLFFKK